MKKTTTIHIALIIVTAIVAGLLAKKLNKEQRRQDKSKVLVSRGVFGGFQKFSADVNWMRFVNYLGSQDSINKDNKANVIKRLKRLISLDPNNDKYFNVGVMALSVRDPKAAVEFLDQACNNEILKDNWKIPFYAGFIITQYYGEKLGEPSAEVAKLAVKYYKMALERVSRVDAKNIYVLNNFIRAKAMSRADYKANPNLAMLKMLFDEWKNASKQAMDSGARLIPDLKTRVLTLCQTLVAENKKDKEVLAFVENVKNKMFVGDHLCLHCLAPYAAGDHFCSKCGHEVKVYGVCSKCGGVLKGDYCSKCGNHKK